MTNQCTCLDDRQCSQILKGRQYLVNFSENHHSCLLSSDYLNQTIMKSKKRKKFHKIRPTTQTNWQFKIAQNSQNKSEIQN